MSTNKQVVTAYLEAFRHLDHAAILACLTDDVEWVLPGRTDIRGKVAFDREIENDDFVGRPRIAVDRLTEEGDVVVAEGQVVAERRDGGHVELRFCDVFELAGGRVRRLTSYLMETAIEGTPG